MIKIMRKLFTCSFAPIVGTYSFNIPQVPGIPFDMSNLQKYLHLILHVFHWNVYLLVNLVAIYLNVIDKWYSECIESCKSRYELILIRNKLQLLRNWSVLYAWHLHINNKEPILISNRWEQTIICTNV